VRPSGGYCRGMMVRPMMTTIESRPLGLRSSPFLRLKVSRDGDNSEDQF
jgi:hypothetical protein